MCCGARKRLDKFQSKAQKTCKIGWGWGNDGEGVSTTLGRSEYEDHHVFRAGQAIELQ